MPEESAIPELWVGSCTGAGEQSFIHDWCRCRPLWSLAGTAAAAVLAEPAAWSGGRMPICRFRHNSHPAETAGWLFDDGCVANAALCDAGIPPALDTDLFVPAALRRQETACVASKQASSFLRAAARLFHHTAESHRSLVYEERIERYAARLTARERGVPGKGVFRCFLSRLSPTGYAIDYTPLTSLCPRIYVIEDETLLAGHRLMGALYRRLAASGQTLLAGICPITGEADHLILPETGVGITLSNGWHTVDFPVYHRIHASRFCRGEGLRHRHSLYRRGTDELLKEAVRCLREAEAHSHQQHSEIARTVDRAALYASLRLWEERI